jgi:(p)ppGpp synthase/HD superfamily hydrolase
MIALPPKVLEALEFAAIAHKGQLRKFPNNVPYISHLAAVAMVLCQGGYEENVVIAGVLHDVLEDTAFTGKDIEQNFGKQVLELVTAVTENKSLSWQDRKNKYLELLAQDSQEAKAISAADLLSNRLSNLLGLRKGVNPWAQFSKNPAEYAKRIFEVDKKRLEIIKIGTNIPFIHELENVMQEVEDLSFAMLGKE